MKLFCRSDSQLVKLPNAEEKQKGKLALTVGQLSTLRFARSLAQIRKQQDLTNQVKATIVPAHRVL